MKVLHNYVLVIASTFYENIVFRKIADEFIMVPIRQKGLGLWNALIYRKSDCKRLKPMKIRLTEEIWKEGNISPALPF